MAKGFGKLTIKSIVFKWPFGRLLGKYIFLTHTYVFMYICIYIYIYIYKSYIIVTFLKSKLMENKYAGGKISH